MPPRRVKVPKAPRESYNPDRPASSLLQAQALHLYEALRWHAAEAQALLATNPRVLRTERDINRYAAEVTRLLHLRTKKRERK